MPASYLLEFKQLLSLVLRTDHFSTWFRFDCVEVISRGGGRHLITIWNGLLHYSLKICKYFLCQVNLASRSFFLFSAAFLWTLGSTKKKTGIEKEWETRQTLHKFHYSFCNFWWPLNANYKSQNTQKQLSLMDRGVAGRHIFWWPSI